MELFRIQIKKTSLKRVFSRLLTFHHLIEDFSNIFFYETFDESRYKDFYKLDIYYKKFVAWKSLPRSCDKASNKVSGLISLRNYFTSF